MSTSTPLFQRLALPIPSGGKIPGIKIHDTRMLRLMEVLLHRATQLRVRRNVVSELPAAAGVVESVNRRFKELWKNRSLVFPQLRHFPQRFSPAALRYAPDR